MTNTWIDIKGFENLYQVNPQGEVRSLNRIIQRKDGKLRAFKGCNLRPLDNQNGYKYVCLKGQKRIAIHRIVAKTFLDNPYNKRTVNHKNGNKADNRLENLEWATRSENLKHAFKTGLHIPYDRHGNKNSNWKHGLSTTYLNNALKKKIDE